MLLTARLDTCSNTKRGLAVTLQGDASLKVFKSDLAPFIEPASADLRKRVEAAALYRTRLEKIGKLDMAFPDVEEASPHENYGGGRQTISIFGCGEPRRRKILYRSCQPIATRSE